MRKLCEDEGYEYYKFCRYAREALSGGQDEPATFIELPAEDGAEPATIPEVTIKEVRIRLSNGVILSSRRGNVQEVISLLNKMLS